jgi:hypothetical protein
MYGTFRCIRYMLVDASVILRPRNHRLIDWHPAKRQVVKLQCAGGATDLIRRAA